MEIDKAKPTDGMPILLEGAASKGTEAIDKVDQRPREVPVTDSQGRSPVEYINQYNSQLSDVRATTLRDGRHGPGPNLSREAIREDPAPDGDRVPPESRTLKEGADHRTSPVADSPNRTPVEYIREHNQRLAEARGESRTTSVGAQGEHQEPLPATLVDRYAQPPRNADPGTQPDRTLGPPATDRPYFDLSDSEIALRKKNVVGIDDLKASSHVNGAYQVLFSDRSSGIYKPGQEEAPGVRADIPVGHYWNREVATSRLDEALGFNLVPTTTEWNGPKGMGSLQKWDEEASPGRSVYWYEIPDREKMAVLDYVSGNSDRHEGNYLTTEARRPVAIDHGCSFPEGSSTAIRSNFVTERIGKQLSPEVFNHVTSVDCNELRTSLEASGLSEPAVAGALARLEEIQSNGMINGSAWLGKIVDAFWRTA
ncbi:hypothetical protein [Microlunatus parietis]|uniref:PI3K/PI4K catalytic domain-containing protein n=1 Tax=Microlunatus parietis TaxID=682979 RepID=A0A7Y9LCW0_9ACTN|nr:hypothetical protein [Microlunatus parietis]NYE75254.1 hypothetical protein [Microlunatus parietis]